LGIIFILQEPLPYVLPKRFHCLVISLYIVLYQYGE